MPGIHNDTGSRRFTGVFKQYGPELKRYLAYRLGNKTDAQDLAQEAYMRLIRVKRQDQIRNPEGYLFRIAVNLANEHLLKQSKSLDSVTLEALDIMGGDSDQNAFQQHIEIREEITTLETILGELPELYRAILLLRKRDGYSHKEIAERLGISPHTVHTYLKRALSQCRGKWPG